MADMFTPKQRSENMSRIRSKGNKTTELRFIAIMRKYGIKGWRRGSKLPGKPDFVFLRERVAVFVDGDFWHGNPNKFRVPKSNQIYWEGKIRRNQERDILIKLTLEGLGWRVLRIWESSLRDEEAVAAKLSLAL